MKQFILLTCLLGMMASCGTQITPSSIATQEENALYKALPFKMDKIQRPVFPDRQVSIIDFGAKSDGITCNTAAFAEAIQHISEKGGGTVIVPEGLWLTGSIEMKNNVRLHTERGAVVLFTEDYDEYPLVQTYYEGRSSWRVQAPLYANKAENIAITGEGIFDGNGQAWRPVKKGNVTVHQWRDFTESGGVINERGDVWYPTERALLGATGAFHGGKGSYEEAMQVKEWLRPVMLNFVSCKNIWLDGVLFRNSPAWCLHPLMCENLILSNLSVENEDWAANGDALDLESCRNALIYRCNFDAGDDGICMKSGKDEEGRKRGIPTENVIIYDCTVFKGHGGFVVGSEMSGGVRNIYLNKCRFIGTDNGLRFKSTRGRGGVVENIYISDVYMANIKSDAILYDLYYGKKDKERTSMPANEATPQFKNIYMKNIVCKKANRAILLQGLPEMKLRDIFLEDVIIEADRGIDCIDAENITLKNVRIVTDDEPVMHQSYSENIIIK